MRQTALLLTLLLLQSLAVGDAFETVLVLESEGKLIGRFASTEEPADTPLMRHTRVTTARLRLLGQPSDVKVTEHTFIHRGTGRIVRAERIQESTGSKVRWTAEVSDGKVRFGDGSEADATDLIDPLCIDYLMGATRREDGRACVLSLQLSRVITVRVTELGRTEKTLRYGLTSDDPPLDLVVSFRNTDGALAGLEDRRQATIIRPAISAVLGAADRAEINQEAVLPVDLPVADFRKLTSLKVRAVIETPGGVVTPEELNGPGQTFEGTVGDGVIKGVFTLEPTRFHGEGAHEIGPRDTTGLEGHLRSGPMIDADHKSILERMKTLVAPSSMISDWRYATIFSQWVSANTAYGPPGWKASDVLELQHGDCGGQARLTVALCRAAGIPARIVSGGMYTTYLGGSFTPHAWVEVHMGEPGWIPIDPAAGESDYIDAGHIRIGDAGGFLPREIEVLDYEPKPAPAEAKPIPFDRGREYVYEYTMNGTRIGENRFVLTAEGSRHRVEIKTKVGPSSFESVLVTDAFGHPVSYELTARGVGGEGKMTTTVADGTASIRAEPPGRDPIELTREIGTDCYIFDNNALPHWALFLPLIGLEAGKTTEIKAFHPQLARVLPLEFEAGQWTEKEWGGGIVNVLPVAVTLTGQHFTMWVDEEFRLLEDHEGGLIIRLLPPEDEDEDDE